MLWLAGFGVLSVFGLLLAAYSRDEDACLLAITLLALSAFAALSWQVDAMYAVPAIDWAIACISLVLWDLRRTRWLAAFATIAAVRLGIHVGISLSPVGSLWLFYHLLNATFVAQVYLISKSGGLRLGRAVFSGLRDVRVAVSSQANVGHG